MGGGNGLGLGVYIFYSSFTPAMFQRQERVTATELMNIYEEDIQAVCCRVKIKRIVYEG